jgi:hypothetical protein
MPAQRSFAMNTPRRIRIILYIAIPIALCLAAAALVVSRPWADTTLEITVQDAVSSSWVWGVTARAQDRTTIAFVTTHLQITGLRPGETTLEVVAPSYEPVSVPIRLHRGSNVLATAVALTGIELPGLVSFACFFKDTPGTLSVELQPVDAEGAAITHHPVMDLAVGCIIREQKLHGGGFSREPSVAEPARGTLLYRGPMEWRWDDSPDTVTRYQASLPFDSVPRGPSSFWYVDCVVIVPDPRAITPGEAADLLDEALAIDDQSARERFLAAQAPRARGFTISTWNVVAGS